MRPLRCIAWIGLTIGGFGATAMAQGDQDPVQVLVDRLDLEKYKATIKGLTQFGDRRQGTDRNRGAIDWIETQLKTYGCTNPERLSYTYTPAAQPRSRWPPSVTSRLPTPIWR